MPTSLLQAGAGHGFHDLTLRHDKGHNGNNHHDDRDGRTDAGAGDAAAERILQGLDALAAQCENLVIVSNEVFSGGADYVGDTDRYLLALARVNNALAARADAVVRVVCGIPVYYKGVEK